MCSDPGNLANLIHIQLPDTGSISPATSSVTQAGSQTLPHTEAESNQLVIVVLFTDEVEHQ